MKLLFTNFHDGDGGGHTTYVVALARALAGRHAVHVAAPAGSWLNRDARAISGVQVWDQSYPNGLQRLAARRRARRQLRACLRQHAFDLVHVNGSADHRLVLSALRGLPRRPRVVLTAHNSKPRAGPGQWWRARRTDQVIAVCDYTRRALLHSAYRRCPLATVHNGVDIDHFAPWPAAAALAERQRWVGHESVLLLGSNAGTASYKGWMDLVEAIAALPPGQRRQVHLLLAGVPISAAQQHQLAALGLAQQVHFAGLLADVRPMLAAIDAGFVLSWGVETISFACREMMAMAKPVLVSDYAGLGENIHGGIDGWQVAPRNRHAIAAMLQQLLQQRGALPAMGLAARRHAEEDFGLDRFVDKTEAVYRGLFTAS